jgi:hypothetical protein
MSNAVTLESLASTVQNCTFLSCELGVRIFGTDAVVRGNIFKSITTAANTGTCVRGESSATRASIRDNEGSNFNMGIKLSATGNTVTGNRFGNATSAAMAIYDFAPGTRYGPIVKSTTSASSVSVSSNSAGPVPSTLATTDPYANLFW